MIGITFLVILSYTRVLSTDCNESCPSDKPYCSEVGCIFECPEPFYINGSNCVSDCGTMFVDENRKCVLACPDQTFYKETLRQSMSKPYLERKCVKCSTQNLLISNMSCVNVCPSESRNIEENNCVTNCSDDRPYKIKTILYGLLHYKCISKCPAFEDNGFCRQSCPVHKVAFNHSCLEQCPMQSPFSFQNSCRSQCPHYAPALGHDNKLCTETKCPEERPFVFNSTCVFHCPDNFPLINSTFNNSNNKGFRYCLNDCGDKYRFKNECVDACPSQTVAVENNCVERCPMNTSYICQVSVGNKCGERSAKQQIHAICVNECPLSMLIWNNTCMYSCQSGLSDFGSDCIKRCPDIRPYIFKNECVESCPDSSPLIDSTFKDYEGFKVCLKDCENKYRFKNNCLDACPSQTVAVKNTCEENCPMYTSYICIVAVGSKCGESTAGKLTHKICVNECPVSMLIWNNTCISSCQRGQAIFGNECTEQCPPDMPYEQNKTSLHDCIYSSCCRIVKKRLTCVQVCSSENYIYKTSCLSYCPSNLLYSGQFCVSKCPKAKPYIENSTITVENWSYTNNRCSYYYYKLTTERKYIQKCVASCGPEMVILNFTCVSSCPDHYAVTENGTCLKQNCDTKYKEVTKFGIVCLDKCKPNSFSLNRTCVSTCTGTGMKFHFNGTCIEKCPQGYSNKLISVENEDHYWRGDILLNNCTKDCGDKYFRYNGTCVHFCEQPLLTFENTCVEECPLNTPFYLTSSVSFNKIVLDKNGRGSESVTKTILKCEFNCPNNTVSLDSKCVQRCPLDRRFIINGSCQSDECNKKYRFHSSSGIRCYDECPKDLFVLNNACVLQCLEHQYVFNQNCVNVCPSTHSIINEKYLPKDQYNCNDRVCTKNLIHARECSKVCPLHKFLYYNECKNICPTESVTYTNKCIEVCPNSHPNVENRTITVAKWNIYLNDWIQEDVIHTIRECVVQCSEKHPIRFRNTCLRQCPDYLPYNANNLCVKTCPRNKLTDLNTKMCVDKCAQTVGQFNKSCYKNCPKPNKYIFDARCVPECPSSHPVAIEEDRFICRKSCGDSRLFKDEKCVSSYQCHDPMIEYNGLCIDRCPDGFVYFAKTCLNSFPVKVAIGILTVLLGLLFLQSGPFILDFIQTTRLLFISEEKIKEMEKQLIQSNSKSNLNGERRILEDELELEPNMEDETVL